MFAVRRIYDDKFLTGFVVVGDRSRPQWNDHILATYESIDYIYAEIIQFVETECRIVKVDITNV